MSSKLERAKKLAGSKVSGKKTDSEVQVKGFQQLVDQLQSISMAQQQSHADISKALKDLGKIIIHANEEGVNMDGVIAAVDALKDRLAVKETGPKEFVVDFERDRNHLMKTGIRLRSVPSKTLN